MVRCPRDFRAICTAVAPDAVGTLRIYNPTPPVYDGHLVPCSSDHNRAIMPNCELQPRELLKNVPTRENVEHPFHIHLAPFQVVGRDGNDDPGRYNQGWKDTVNLDNGGRVELLIRFDGYRGKYVFHCHNLEPELAHF